MQENIKIYEPEKSDIKLVEFLKGKDYKKIVLVSYHGAGDQVMFKAPLRKLRSLFPNIQIDVAVCAGIDQNKIIPDAIEIGGDWRETLPDKYDLVVQINFPCENANDTTYTKSEICCIKELGIDPVSGYEKIKAKPLVGLCFQITSLPHLCNADEDVAKKIWQDVIDAGCVPFELTIQHAYHNPINVKYPFIDKTLRNWPPELDTLISVTAKCDAVISVVTGVFHIAMAVLGKEKVMLLEKEIPKGCFTHDFINTSNLKSYDHEVFKWLRNLRIA
jgi:hypothetical protein